MGMGITGIGMGITGMGTALFSLPQFPWEGWRGGDTVLNPFLSDPWDSVCSLRGHSQPGSQQPPPAPGAVQGWHSVCHGQQ